MKKALGNRVLAIFGIFGLLMCLLISVFASGVFWLENQSDESQREITSRMVVEKISDQSFLVSKTVFLDEQVIIEVDQGSNWSNFWWGQQISAEGLVRIDVGVDYSKLTEEDITVDPDNKNVIIDLPEAEILDASVQGPIEVESNNGILRQLLDNDPTRDHNLAAGELIVEAEASLLQNNSVFDEAELDAVNFLKLVLADLDYEVIIE